MSARTSLLTAFTFATLCVPLSARDALDAFQAKYTKLTSVSCAFRDRSGVHGSLKATKGGSYRVTLPDREFICDGKTVWNVVPNTKTVIVNTYKPTSDEVSLERVFFLMLNIYKPTLTSSSKTGATIHLTAPHESAVIANIHDVDVSLDSKNVITSVSISEYGSVTTWYLSKLVLNKRIAAKTFIYQIPVGWQKIDLR